MSLAMSFWQESIGFPLITVMTLWPVLGLFGILKVPSLRWVDRIAYLVAIGHLILSVFLVYVFDESYIGFQFVEQFSLLGMSYAVGIDGMNILFVPLISIITGLALLFQSTEQNESNRRKLIATLLGHQAILIAAFCALNVMQFWVLTALELMPFFVVINRSPDNQNKQQLRVMVGQYFGASLLMTLGGFLLLAFGLVGSEHDLSFDLNTLVENNTYLHDETLIFILLFYGFAIRIPLFPFHGWLPMLLQQEKVTAIAMSVIGLKLGVYAILRFICPLVPGVVEQWASFVMLLSVASIIYGILLAYMQNNSYRMLAFVFVGQSGVLVLGVFSFNTEALEGLLLLIPVYGLSAIGLLLSISLIYQQTKTALIPRLGGLFESHSMIAVLFLVMALSNATLFGSIGLDARQLLIEGVIKEYDWLIPISVLVGQVLSAGLMLWLFQSLFLTPNKRGFPPLTRPPFRLQGILIAIILCSLQIGTGVFSEAMGDLIDNTVMESINQYPVHSTQNHQVDEPMPDNDIMNKEAP